MADGRTRRRRPMRRSGCGSGAEPWGVWANKHDWNEWLMSQLLIYKTAVPVTHARHADAAVEMRGDYGFSNAVNSVPLMAAEFPLAASEYPIIFAGQEDETLPAAVLGVRGKENLFLSGTAWEAKYIPAFIRRYPFVFLRIDDRFMLCIDEEYAGFNREG